MFPDRVKGRTAALSAASSRANLRLSRDAFSGGAGLGPLTFFSQARCLSVTGKGGVGKTTVSGVIANLAARNGLRAMVVQIGAPGAQHEPEAAHLSRLFGREEALGYEAVLLEPKKRAARSGPGRYGRTPPWSSTFTCTGCVGFPGAWSRAAPWTSWPRPSRGCRTCWFLGKVKQMERAAAAGEPDAADLIILDAPAAGHAVRFLQSPHGLLDAAGGGP